MAQTQFEIIKELHKFPEVPGREYQKELNLVSWYGKEPRYDMRDWKANHEKAGRGITLTEDEFRELLEAGEQILF